MTTEQTGTDLHTRIREALQRRLKLAQEAGPPDQRTWTTGGGYPETGPMQVASADGRLVAEPETDWHAEIARHIAATDPAAEIRRAEALLRILDRHAPGVVTYAGGGENTECRGCEETYPCADVRDLAAGEGITEPA